MIIGLTGGIGSGKTTVAALLAKKGAFVIDTDLIARDVVEPGPVLDTIQREFGAGVIRADGTLDRPALARIIFADDAKRARLNQLTHPEILKRVLSIIATQPHGAMVVVVVPLLFESGFERSCDQVLVVMAPPDLRRQRLQERDGISGTDVESRMRAQLPDTEHERRAGIIIRNDGNLTALGREVDRAWSKLVDAASPAAK